MELKIYSPSSDGFIKEISWNYEEIKKEVAEKVKYYASMVYTDDQIKEAKTDRATLNKFVQALEGKRKEIKKQCLAPYEEFEKQMKETVAIVNEPINLIDSQVKAFEEQKKAEKLAQIKEYWTNTEIQLPIPLTFNQIFNEKWLNASVKMSTVEAEIDARLKQIDTDLATLSKLPEFSFEAIEVYKDTLDMNRAISEGQRLADIAKRKAEAAATTEKSSATEQAATISKTETVEEVVVAKNETTTPPQWIAFRAKLTVPQATLLRQFFELNNIEFEAI